MNKGWVIAVIIILVILVIIGFGWRAFSKQAVARGLSDREYLDTHPFSRSKLGRTIQNYKEMSSTKL